MTRRQRLVQSSFSLASIAFFLSLGLGGCGQSQENSGAGGGIFIDGEFQPACDAPVPPEAEPDLLEAPIFAADELPPGSAVEADIEVDAETRRVRVELVDIWRLEDPPVDSVELETSGDETLSVSLSTDFDTRGRYYFRITLCGDDCEAGRVVFVVVENPQAPNVRGDDPYERLVYEGAVEVAGTTTCHWPDSVAIQ